MLVRRQPAPARHAISRLDRHLADRADCAGYGDVVTVSRPVGGVLSAPRGVVTIHLSGLPGDCPLCGGGRAAQVPRLALLRVGFTEPPGSPRALVRSYRTVSPSPVRAGARHRQSALCCTVLRVAPTGR